jgi:hypothetical protein
LIELSFALDKYVVLGFKGWYEITKAVETEIALILAVKLNMVTDPNVLYK